MGLEKLAEDVDQLWAAFEKEMAQMMKEFKLALDIDLVNRSR